MDGVLSQEEINALLNEPGAEASDSAENELSDAQKDAIGEIANISMGTAATTLFSLVNHKVEISTPVVSYGTWDDIVQEYEKPCVFIRIAYTVGLDGSNILVLREHDVKVITDLMMGGDGTNTDGELGELHLSAISEAMNQMMGSAATSLSSMLNRKIDISPPNATVINLQEDIDEAEIDSFLTGKFVKISFHMEIGDLVDSTIMQLYPISFAKDMCDGVAKTMEMDSQSVTADSSAANSGNPAGAQPAAASAAHHRHAGHRHPAGPDRCARPLRGRQVDRHHHAAGRQRRHRGHHRSGHQQHHDRCCRFHGAIVCAYYSWRGARGAW